MKYSNYNRQTGEFIMTEIYNLEIPKNLETPDVNGIERSVNVKLSRSAGWHYANEAMSFIPAYSECRGIVVPFDITYVYRTGFVLNHRSGMFKQKIPIGIFFAVCFPYSTLETVHSMIQSGTKAINEDYFMIRSPEKLADCLLKRKNSVDPLHALDRFKTLFTRQTAIRNNHRLKSLLSLKHFTGCSLAGDVVVFDGVLPRGVCLTDDVIFRLEHSGISSVELITTSGTALSVPLLTQPYFNLTSLDRPLTQEERRNVLHWEKEGTFGQIGRCTFEPVTLPTENTLTVYCLIINRLINFPLVGVDIDMNSYENQTLTTLEDEIGIINTGDHMLVDDRVLSSANMLEGVSSITFDRGRIYNAIRSEESSLVIPKNPENPYTLIAGSGQTKLVKPVRHLSQDAVKIRNASQGIEDGTDVFENKGIGKTTPLCVTTIMKDRKLYVPLYEVENRKNTRRVTEILCSDVESLCVAEYNADLSQKYVLANIGGVTKYVHSEQVTHLRVSPFSSTSFSRGTAVYLNHADLKRSQMAAKTAEQARTILMPERALVETGIESIAVHAGTQFIPSKTVAEIVADFSDAHRLILPEDWEEHQFDLIVLEKDMTVTKYKLESVQSRNISAVFELRHQRTQKGSCTWANIVPAKERYYESHDIVWQHHSVHQSTIPVDSPVCLDYHAKGDPEYFNTSVGCGINVRVMFGFYHGYTVDDASVISDSFIRKMSMDTPVMLVKECYQPLDTEDGVSEHMGFTKRPVSGFYPNGLPKVGTYIYGGFPVIYRYKLDTETGLITEDNVCLDYDECGEVVSVQEIGEKIRVTLYNVVHLKIGDKLSGRHGNKTIVAKILPRELMPYDYETGESIDWILNPLSLSSRMNIGQLPEMFAQAKQVACGGGTKIEPLYESVFEKYIREHADIESLTMRDIVDGETGRKYPNKMFVGYMYILRSVHITDDKVHAIGDSAELDQGFLQPVGRGPKNQRGQSVGAYETDLLIAKGCDNILAEANGIMSSDVSTYHKLMKDIQSWKTDSISDPGNNQLISHYVMATLSLYVWTEQKGNSFRKRFASDDIIRRFQKLSTSNLANDIIDPRLCLGFSYFDLGTEIVVPIAVEKLNIGRIITILKPLFNESDYEVTQLTAKTAVGIIEETLFVTTKYHKKLDANLYFVSNEYSPEAETGMPKLVEMLRFQPVSFWKELLLKRLNKQEEVSGEFNEQLRHILVFADMVEKTGGLKQFISTVVPVLPLKYRSLAVDERFMHDITKGYLTVARACSGERQASLKDKQAYAALKNLLLSSNGEYKSIFDFLFDKDNNGRVRNMMLKRRVKHSMRANLTPMGYGHPDEIGVPLIQAAFMYQPFVNREIRRAFPALSDFVGVDEITMSEMIASILTLPLDKVKELTGNTIRSRSDISQMRERIAAVCNGRYVYYNRAPALHETSLRGGRVFTHNDDVLRINTLLTAEQNADFDGDQEPVCAVFSDGAVKDVETKLLPSTQVKRSNDGEVSLRINQDSLLGLYMATVDEPDMEGNPVAIGSIDQLKESVWMGIVKFGDTVVLPSGENTFKTTAGRLMVSHTIDKLKSASVDASGFSIPIVNKCLNSKDDNAVKMSLRTLTNALADNMSSLAATNIISELQELGYRANHSMNMTLSLNDFKAIEDIPSINSELVESLQSLGTWEDYGLLPDNWYVEFDQKIADYKKNLNIRSRLGKDNAFFKMVDSGAKGGDTQLSNMFGMIGFVQGNNGILPTPILSGYIQGLSQFQSESMGYEQRINALSTVHGTSAPGVSLRTGSFELSGLKVLETTGKYPEYPHLIVYNRDFTDIKYEIITETGKAADRDLKAYAYKGRQLNKILVSQLAKNPRGTVKLDNGYIIRFNVTPDKDFMKFVESRLSDNDKKEVASAIDKQDYLCGAKSFMNYFGDNSGLAQDYAGLNQVGKGQVPVGTQIGIRASTSLAEPLSQMVISKRNLVASDEAYSALGVYRQAVLHGKLFSNNRSNIAILAPEDGTVSVQQRDDGTLFVVFGESGLTHFWTVPVEEEDTRDIWVQDGDFVFEAQILSSLKGDTPDARIHPTMSMGWSTVAHRDLLYRDVWLNPSAYAVQYARFIYYKYLVGLYTNSTKLDLMHFGGFPLQQLRTARLLKTPDKDYTAVEYINLAKVIDKKLDDILYSMELLNGPRTILHTSGAIASYVFQDSMASFERSFMSDFVEERGCIGKAVLGIPQTKEISSAGIVYAPTEFGTVKLHDERPEPLQRVVKIWEDKEATDNEDDGSVDLSGLLDLMNDDTGMDSPGVTESELDGIGLDVLLDDPLQLEELDGSHLFEN